MTGERPGPVPRPLRAQYGMWSVLQPEVIEYFENDNGRPSRYVLCVCTGCGRSDYVRTTTLRQGKSSSCRSCYNASILERKSKALAAKAKKLRGR